MTGGAIEFRSDDGPVVVLVGYDAYDSDFGHIVAEIRADGLTCDHAALSLRGDGLALFLASLVADWTGWAGTRRWESLRGELSIEASHRGHAVELLFIAKQGEPLDAWQLRLPVHVNPGEPLSRLAAASVRVIKTW